MNAQSQLEFTTIPLNEDKETVSNMAQEIVPEFCTISWTCATAQATYNLGLIFQNCDQPLSKKQVIEKLLELSLIQSFESVSMSKDSSRDIPQLHFTFVAAWRLASLHITGNALQKERLKHQYGLEPGALWKEEHHRAGIEKIKQTLEHEGYFQSTLQESISENNELCVKHVTLSIDLGPQYHIGTTVVHLTSTAIDQDELAVLQRTLTKKINRALKGTQYNKKKLQEELKILKQYLKNKGYLNAQCALQMKVAHNNQKIMLALDINLEFKKSFDCIGNHFFTTAFLKDFIFAYGKNLFLVPPEYIAEDIKKEYLKKGFLQCTVQSFDDGNQIIFSIVEGPRIQITDVICTGTTYVQKAECQQVFKTLLRNKYYDESLYHECCYKFIEHLQDAGFWQAQIIEKKIVYDDQEHAQIEIIVHEGSQVCVRCEQIECDATDTQLAHKLQRFEKNYQKSRPLSLSYLEETQKKILRVVQKQGYQQAKIVPEYETNSDKPFLRWIIKNTDTKVHFGASYIRGTSSLDSSYIIRELRYQQGDVWDDDKISSSLKQLQSCGIFDHVAIVPLDLSRSSRSALITVVQDKYIETRMRAGMQLVGYNFDISTATYTLGAVGIWKNPFNRADKLFGQCLITRFQKDASLSYWHSGFWHIPLRTEYKVYISSFDEPLFPGSKHILYNLEQAGFLVCFSYDYYRALFGLSASLEAMKLKHIRTSWAQAINFSPRLVDKSVNYVIIEPTYFFDNLDNKLYPSSGSVVLASAKLMQPFTRIHTGFLKFLVEASFFYPLRSTVLACRLRAGHIMSSCFNVIMPSERFYLGGAFSLRAYETDHVPPLSCISCDSLLTAVPTGGKTMYNGTLELRYNLYRALHGVLFFDFGALSQDVFADIYSKKPVTAVGTGLRYHTAVGAVRFDYGISLHRDSWFRQAWFLTFGQIF